MRSFFLLASLLVSLIGHRYTLKHSLRIGEFHHLVMLATAGLMLLCQSSHFLMLFVALECVALCFYALVAFNRESAKSLEAGIKYLIFGVKKLANKQRFPNSWPFICILAQNMQIRNLRYERYLIYARKKGERLRNLQLQKSDILLKNQTTGFSMQHIFFSVSQLVLGPT